MGCSFEHFIWSVIWFFCLILSWGLAFLAAVVYVFVSPFAACLDFCLPFERVLMKGVGLPLFCARRMVEGHVGC
ncbi:hypothetical protein Pelo_6635 [Pelomyxa schiedti]|nr:hypothetical protein Pelo_6635 [Pelomyxa schiedti]